ncbi:MAG: glucose-6-phosphate isomerase [Verrucomicrobiae bacterium]|nr:glucose-6-phosphate isomerase [Verrucomicrobiae bacterium]
MNKEQLFKRFQTFYWRNDDIGMAMDISRMNFTDEFMIKNQRRAERAILSMIKLEKGAIANPTENRMVGHYWLRTPELAPDREITKSIKSTVEEVKKFAESVHTQKIKSQNGLKFDNLLVIGIGGSILGPQFVSNALGDVATDKMRPYFIDNTDPDGFDRILKILGNQLDRTLAIVISKSGTTAETRNAMAEIEYAYSQKGLVFAKHAVAITKMDESSKLFKKATEEGWLGIFPMWDWVGGRTSETSAVGLLPAALQGLNIDDLLWGASKCDEFTRGKDVRKNPAAMLALMWYYAGGGKGNKNMVILPYKDRLELFSRYLQQLVMESLGKETDLDGKVVNQGITVYGNKGSTDQHAYIQQLRDGRNDFFVTFIEVLKDRASGAFNLQADDLMKDLGEMPDVTSGDYLIGFYLGTRKALYEKGRESITITLTDVSAKTVGALIALFERAVGLYANMIKINAYDQPGVEAGKKAAKEALILQHRILKFLREHVEQPYSLLEIAQGIITEEEKTKGIRPEDMLEEIYLICDHLAANPERRIEKISSMVLTATAFKALRYI